MKKMHTEDLIPYWMGLQGIADVKFLGKAMIALMIRYWIDFPSGRRNLKKRETALRILILRLYWLVAKQKPILPFHRPSGWFLDGNKVVVLREKNLSLKHNCEVKCLNYWGNPEITINNYSEAEVIELRSPLIVHQWEAKYLAKNPDFAKFWAENASPYEEGKQQARQLIDALKKNTR